MCGSLGHFLESEVGMALLASATHVQTPLGHFLAGDVGMALLASATQVRLSVASVWEVSGPVGL